MSKNTEGLTLGQLGEINAGLHAELARLNEQVRALAAEVYAAMSHVENSAKAIHNWNQWAGSCDRIAENIDTPNTDAILNEVRAQGADSVRGYHKARHEELSDVDAIASNRHAAAMLCASDVAARIRAGEVTV